MTPLEILLERVYGRCVHDAETDCMNWTGAVQPKSKSPTIRRADGGQGASLRRMLLEVAKGRPAPPKMVATYMCGNRACVRLEHQGLISRAELQKRNDSQFDAAARLRKSYRISVKVRLAKAKLTLDLAREIREADGTYFEISKKYGVSMHTVGSIKRGLTWRDLDNPFTRLAA